MIGRCWCDCVVFCVNVVWKGWCLSNGKFVMVLVVCVMLVFGGSGRLIFILLMLCWFMFRLVMVDVFCFILIIFLWFGMYWMIRVNVSLYFLLRCILVLLMLKLLWWIRLFVRWLLRNLVLFVVLSWVWCLRLVLKGLCCFCVIR